VSDAATLFDALVSERGGPGALTVAQLATARAVARLLADDALDPRGANTAGELLKLLPPPGALATETDLSRLDDRELDVLLVLTAKARGEPINAPIDVSRLSAEQRAELDALDAQRRAIDQEQRDREQRLRADVARLEGQLHTALIEGDVLRHRLASLTAGASASADEEPSPAAPEIEQRTDAPENVAASPAPEPAPANVIPFATDAGWRRFDHNG
jgi:hypothetical protein